MAVSIGELNRRKDLLKMMFYIIEKDVQQFDHQAYETWQAIMEQNQGEQGISELALSDKRFIASLRIFASTVEEYTSDD